MNDTLARPLIESGTPATSAIFRGQSGEGTDVTVSTGKLFS
jgi:hypothetical protein